MNFDELMDWWRKLAPSSPPSMYFSNVDGKWMEITEACRYLEHKYRNRIEEDNDAER